MNNEFWQAFLVNQTVRTVGLISLFFILAYINHRFSSRLARRLIGLNRFTRASRRPSFQRQETLRGLFRGVISFFGFLAAALASLSLFAETDTLVWMVGLFSAGFGFAARPVISDLLTGIGLMFDNTFEVGDKVEMIGVLSNNIEGVVEAVYLRNTIIRAQTGEPITVPNGEIRLLRNFSRGKHSLTKIRLNIATSDLTEALAVLDILRDEAPGLLPNLLEPWQLISETGEMGQHTEITLVSKAKFGKGAEMRPRLLSLIEERFTQANISLKD